MNKLTGFLYARPSFIEGISRLIDFGNVLQVYNSSLTPEQADFLALSSDWSVIGDDLSIVMDTYSDVDLRVTEELLRQAHEVIIAEMEESIVKTSS